jgi:hypothetical protein
MSQNVVKFSSDIRPIFNQFKGPMMWRLDLTNYEHVMANLEIIKYHVNSSDDPMPPPPLDPLSPDQIQLFNEWVKGGCQR